MNGFLTNEPIFEEGARALLKALEETKDESERLVIACEWLADAFEQGWDKNNVNQELAEQAEWIRTRLNRGEIDEALFLIARHIREIQRGTA